MKGYRYYKRQKKKLSTMTATADCPRFKRITVRRIRPEETLVERSESEITGSNTQRVTTTVTSTT